MLEDIVKGWANENKELMVVYIVTIFSGVFAGYYMIPSISSKVIKSIQTTGSVKNLLIISLFAAYAFISCADLAKRYLEDIFVPDFNRDIRNEIYRYVISSYDKGKDIELGKLLNIMSYLPSSIRNIMLDI